MLAEDSTEQHEKALEAALRYAKRGWHVFPWNVGECWAYKAARNSGGRRWGMTTDPDEIRRDFALYPDAGVGIATGAESGIFVAETDTKEGGHANDGAVSLAELEAKYGALPPTLEAESPSGSVHRYYKHPGFYIKSSPSKVGPGIDVKGDGGMVIAPPSIKPKGVYRWRNDLPIADAPQWLLDLATAKKEEKEPVEDENEPQQPAFEAPYYDGDNSRKSRKKYARRVKQTLFNRLSRTEAGGRNHELNKCAFLLGKLVAAGALRSGPVEEALYLASEINGYVRDRGISKTKATLRSGFGSGIKQPWTFHQEQHHYSEAGHERKDRPKGAWPFESAKDFSTDYNKKWIIKYVIAPGEVSTWCALPKKGKSMLLGDIALHITAKVDWRGYRTKVTGAVVYFALERADLVKRRFNTQAKQHGIDPATLSFHVVNQVIDMMNPQCVERFVATIKAIEHESGVPVVMIIIDTTAKAIAAGGGEENSAKDKGMMRANARRILLEVESLHIALISHTGKDPEKGERGSNAGLGDDDMLVVMNGQSAIITARNDGAEGLLTNYKITSVVVGEDEDGDKIDIAVIDPDTTATAAAPRTRPKGQPGMALDFLVEAINEVGQLPPASLGLPRSVVRVVTVEQWEDQCQKRRFAGGGTGNASAFRKAFDRAADKLQELHLIAIMGDYAWIVYE